MAANNELTKLYQERKESALNLLEKIRSLVVDFDHDELNWGHAGSLGHVVEELNNIHEFLDN